MEFVDNVYVRSAAELVHDAAAGAFPGAVLLIASIAVTVTVVPSRRCARLAGLGNRLLGG